MKLLSESAKRLARVCALAANRLLRFAEQPEGNITDTARVTVGASNGGATRAIVITTFSERFFSDCIPLIHKLRHSTIEAPIYVVVNADFGKQFDPSSRSQFLKQLAEFDDCYPICSGRPLGMSALWNLGIRQAGAQITAVLSDDVSIDETLAGPCLDEMFKVAELQDFVLLNDSFGHFAISLNCIASVGWFDERFLGFGEEDGDYAWRYQECFETPIPRIYVGGITNRQAASGYEVIKPNSGGRRSLFNSILLREKFEFGNFGSHRGMFSQSATRRVPELDLYPGDKFREQYFPLLFEAKPSAVQLAISNALRSALLSSSQINRASDSLSTSSSDSEHRASRDQSLDI